MSDIATTDTQPFFMDIWREHRFRVDIVAREAGVPMNAIFALLRFQPVEAQNAIKVLDELSSLYHQEYTLETVRIKLIDKGDHHATTIT
jgi:hypothetical protein